MNRSRSRSPVTVSPIRATNPLGRPFGGGRGRGTSSKGRWIRSGQRFNNRDKSASKSPKRYNSSRNRDFHNDRYRPNDRRSINTRFKAIEKDDGRKSPEPKKIDSVSRTNQETGNARNVHHINDPPPPGTEDDIEHVEKLANKI